MIGEILKVGSGGRLNFPAFPKKAKKLRLPASFCGYYSREGYYFREIPDEYGFDVE